MARRSVCLPIVFVLAVLLQSWPATAWAADMFGRAEAPANHDEAANPEPPPAAIPAFTLPAPIRALVGRATAVQSRLNSELRGQLQLARE